MSRIAFYLDNIDIWKSGIWYHRQDVPTRALMKRGHNAMQLVMVDKIPDKYMEFPNTVVVGRIYPDHSNPLKAIRDYQKQGKRVICDIDDNYWSVDPSNPSKFVSNAYKDMYETMLKEADAVTTPSKYLAKKIKKLTKKPVFFCPNGIDYDDYKERPRINGQLEKKREAALENLTNASAELGVKDKKKFREAVDTILPYDRKLKVGYMGAASHWKDLQLIADVVLELQKNYNFSFGLYGMVGEPLEAAMYSYGKLLTSGSKPEQNEYFKGALDFYDKLKNMDMYHVPFYPPEMHPEILSECDFDIALAPLEDSEFNRGKSNIKFYEYAAVGTVTLASDVLPYKEECNYRAKNTFKDWYNKLEKLLVDEEFRNKILKQQQDWVKEHRSLEKIGLAWEMACQKPGGLEVTNQREWKKHFWKL